MSTDPSEDSELSDDGVKRTKHRSPNYPVVGLQKAVERSQELYAKYKRAWVPIHIAQELWGYRPHGGAGNQAVAALKAYGLVDVEGDGKSRKVRLTETAYRIVLSSPDRPDLLKKAAISPPIHNELWERYKAEEHFPDDELIRHYLQWDRPGGTFNADAVDSFIENFRSSLRYAGLLAGATVNEADQDEGPLPLPPLPYPPRLGDLVQRYSGPGKYLYAQPRRVQGVSDDGQWVFIEGENEAKPIDEVVVMKMTSGPKPSSQMPPLNPYAGASAPPIGAKAAGDGRPEPDEWGVPPLRFPLPRGNVIEIRLKSKVSAAEFKKIKKIFDLSAFAFLEDEAAEELMGEDKEDEAKSDDD
jgi:hypothetical protein